MWYIDRDSRHRWISHRVKRRVVHRKTRYQLVEIFDTYEYGRMVVLDGMIQSAESDEALYHELLVHPAMLAHPRPQRVLVLGAGEGATVREVLKHPSVEKVTMIDIDREFVDLCKRYLTKWHRGVFKDERVELIYDDAYAHLRKGKDRYDLVIGDISDPSEKGPSRSVYAAEFYTLVKKVLEADGIFVTHATAVHYVRKESHARDMVENLRGLFPRVEPYYEYIPSFGSLWCFVASSFRFSLWSISPKLLARRLSNRRIRDLSYYEPRLHERIFVIPSYIGGQLGFGS